MPQIFRLGSYRVFFWFDKGMPFEPVLVHVSKGVPAENATKLWITKARDVSQLITIQGFPNMN